MKIKVECDFDFDFKNLDKIIDGINDIVQDAGMSVETHAKRTVPVDTGKLRASITSVFSQSKTNPSFEVGTDVEYGKYVEYGTWKMAARPFLQPAFEDEAQKIQKEIMALLARFL